MTEVSAVTSAEPKVVDSQVHLWAHDSPSRPWPRTHGRVAEAHLAAAPSAQDLLRWMDYAGVDAAVLVPPSWEGDRNDLAIAAAQAWPERFAVMGRIPLADPTAWSQLAHWREQPGMLGVRLTLHRSPWREWLATGRLAGFWVAAARAEIPVSIYAPAQYAAIGAIAREHPDLRLSVDHLGLPLGCRDTDAIALMEPLVALSRYPNIAVKATAVPCHSSQPPPFPAWHAPLLRLVDAFGAQRVFWGSDLTRLPCSYRDCADLFRRDLNYLSPSDRTWVLGRGIRSWLRWEPTTPQLV